MTLELISKKDRHNYEYDFDPLSETAAANVVRMVGQRKRVLEIGCGPGSITKLLAHHGQCLVTGLEIDPEAISKVTQFCSSVIKADLNSSDWPHLLDGVEKFDVVVAADVLEHLYDPWMNLKHLIHFIRPDGFVVISLPHVGHAGITACLINGNFEYRNLGLLDRTHIRFFCLKNIEDLFASAGLKIIEANYVIKAPEETEFATEWRKLPSTLRQALSSGPHAHVYQVVVKAVPFDYLGNTISLTPPKPRGRIMINIRLLKTRIGKHFSPDTKHKIRMRIKQFGIKW